MSPSGLFTMILLAPFFDAITSWSMSDSSKFGCRGISSVLCFVICKDLIFQSTTEVCGFPPFSTSSVFSISHIHLVSVVCYNLRCVFFPCLNSSFFWYRDFSLDVNFMGCICIANFYLSEV